MVSVVKKIANKLFESGKHRAGNKISIENCCLKNISAVFTIAKKINHLVYDVNHIVENIFLVNDSVNCLFAVYKLFV